MSSALVVILVLMTFPDGPNSLGLWRGGYICYTDSQDDRGRSNLPYQAFCILLILIPGLYNCG